MSNKIYNFLSFVLVCGSISFGVWKYKFDYKTTCTGLQYRIDHKNSVKKDDNENDNKDDKYLYIEREVYFNKKLIVPANEHPYYPFLVSCKDVEKYNFDSGIYEILNVMGKDDRYTIKLLAKNIMPNNVIDYLNDKHKINIKEDSELVLKLHIKDIVEKENLQSVFEDYTEMKKKEKEENAKKQLEIDKKILAKHFKDLKLDVITTDSGLSYIIDTPGDEQKINDNQIISLEYTLKTLDNKCIDTNIESVAKENNLYDDKRHYEPLELEYSKLDQTIIKGLAEGLKLLTKNAEATFYVPSTLGYGANGVQNVIPENAILIFKTKIVNVKDIEQQKKPEHQEQSKENKDTKKSTSQKKKNKK